MANSKKQKSDRDALPGYEHLTMGDQMRAAGISAKEVTDPVTGAVENKRRKYLENRIADRTAKFAKGQAKSSKC